MRFAFSPSELVVGISGLRIFVQKFQIRAGGRGVEVVVILFDVFAVIPFPVGEAEKPLFEDRIFFVPQRERETDVLMAVAEAADAVFAPAIGARARVIVREIIPGVAVRAVVFANRAPLAFGKIRPPALPMDLRARCWLATSRSSAVIKCDMYLSYRRKLARA